MAITPIELQNNLDKYLALSKTEDIYISRDGVVIAVLTKPKEDAVEIAKSLFGILPDDITLEDAREERLNSI